MRVFYRMSLCMYSYYSYLCLIIGGSKNCFIFWMKLGQPVPHRFLCEENFWRWCHWFAVGRCPSRHPSNSVRALKEARNSDPNLEKSSCFLYPLPDS